MTDQVFIKQLNRLLKSLPQEERDDILADYAEHIRIARESGKSDSELFRDLGDPSTIAKAIIAEYHVGVASRTKSVAALLRAIFSGIGLSFLNFVILLPPFLVFLVMFGVVYVISWLLILSPVVAVYGVTQGVSIGVIFLSCITLGVGILGVLGESWFIKKLFAEWVIRYLRFNLHLAKRGV
ncbi:DUF1700 domain-containing protein [Alicyclobacillus acidiphilus]|uniref:DUF1700 domain-containing protein n=1 Tax=Alicyclobacillus acidiphilus TaxID=182455 RepID=UPI00082CA404|nr:DUF1700 domain-containing protein [Alicyclobacillus acidiphilus]